MSCSMNVRDPGREGNSSIPRESEEISCYSCEIVYAACAADQGNDGEQNRHPSGGHGDAEYVDGWISGTVFQGGREVGNVVADGDEGGGRGGRSLGGKLSTSLWE